MSSNEKRTWWFWIKVWLPVAIGIAVIAFESTEPFGSDHTSYPLRVIFEALFGHVSSARWEVIHLCIRKSGHFIGYGPVSYTHLDVYKRQTCRCSPRPPFRLPCFT